MTFKLSESTSEHRRNHALFSSKRVLTRIEAIKYLHRNMGYTLNSANFTLHHWTSIGAIPSQLKEGRRYYVLSDLLKFSNPEDRKRLVRIAKEKVKGIRSEALEPVQAIQEDLMLQQMKTYTEQPELPLDPVDRLNSLPIEERRKVFAEEFMNAKEVLRNYRTDCKQLARLARDNKLDRIKVRCVKTNQPRYAYPRDQITKLFKTRNSVLFPSTGSEVFI